jgi:hypothetical protein
LSNWQVGYIQTIFVHFMRDEYEHTNAEWNVPTPIRDADNVNVPAPWYSQGSHRSARAGSPRVFVGMIDHPWHVAEWMDPRTSAPNSLVRSSRRLTLVAWLIAKEQAGSVPIFLKNIRWEINFTVNIDCSRPIANRATNVGPGMNAPMVGEGQGSFTPLLGGTIYNVAVNRPSRLSARGGTESTSVAQSFRSRPALDTSAPSIRLNANAGGTPGTYSPAQIGVRHGPGAPLPPAVQLGLGQPVAAGASTVRVHAAGSNGLGFRIPILSAGIDLIREQVWRLLERHAPSLARILRQGVLEWLKEKLGVALQAIIDFAARPVRAIGNVVSSVRQHFGNLVVWMRDAAARIAHNDCGPISEAADKIHQVFEGLTAPVVEQVKHYAGVVKGFFHGLWDRFGAPIWNLLRSIGGAIWEEVQRIGRWIWEQTRPVRDWLSSAWRWLKNLIGIGEGEEGQNGILQWFQRKASAAWDWVLARIEPFKRPLLSIAGVLVMLSPAGPIIAIGVAAAGILRGIQWIRQNLRSRTATVQQQSFLRGTILPGVLGAIDRVSGIVNTIANGIIGTLRRVVAGIGDLAAAVSSISILRFASGFIGWLADGFRGLLDWAVVGVQGVANGIQNGLQSVGGFARRLIDFLEEIERLLRNFFRLVGGIFRRIWNAIPKCLRDPFVDFLVPLILRQIPFFSELAATPEAWQQTRAQVNTLLVQVFVNFDLIGAMTTTFGLVVRILRIPVDLMGQLLDKAAQAWDLVLARPMRFIGNALKAILMGVGFFARNFLSHLWFGIQGWLLNAVEQSGTGVRPPASWEPRAIFGFVLDLMGISLDHVLDLLARRVGRPIVDRIRRMINVLTGAWEWVKVAIEEGPAGLWRMVVERLGNLARMVLEAAVGWVMTRIFAIVSARLTAMAASAGLSSILEAVVAIYAAIRTAMEYARRIIQMLINVFDGIIQIAGGVLDPAARTLEAAFRNAMPIVIGFLANYAGLGGIGGRIREVVLDIRERVDNAILWLIDRALAAGRWLLDRLRAGVAAVVQWWRERRPFRAANGAEHHIMFRGEEANAVLFVGSVERPLEEYLQRIDARIYGERLAAIRRIQDSINEFRRRTVQHSTGIAQERMAHPSQESGRQISQLLRALAVELATLPDPDHPEQSLVMPPSRITVMQTKPTSGAEAGFTGNSRDAEIVDIKPLTVHPGPLAGSEASAYSPLLLAVREQRPRAYAAGHLLGAHLYGPGHVPWNLAPITISANNLMTSRIENPLHGRIFNENQIIHYRVQVRYPSNPSPGPQVAGEGFLPTQISFVVKTMKLKPEVAATAARTPGGIDRARAIAENWQDDESIPFEPIPSTPPLDVPTGISAFERLSALRLGTQRNLTWRQFFRANNLQRLSKELQDRLKDL